MNLFIMIISVFSCIFFAVIGVVFKSNSGAMAQERISRALGKSPELMPSEDQQNLKERVFQPVIRQVITGLSRFSSKTQGSKIESRLAIAGLSGKWEGVEWQAFRLVLGIFIALALLGLVALLRAPVLTCVEMTVIGFVLGYILPNTWLSTRVNRRRNEIRDTLPDVLDLLTVSVEAGLGFDAALLKVVEKRKGVLAEEFLRVLQEIKMGRPRREALRDLGSRNQVEELANFVASLVQADQLGISIANVLRNQALQMRQRRRQRAEEKAQKAPVKMMIPLVLFVFPGIFIVVLGPALIQILTNFK